MIQGFSSDEYARTLFRDAPICLAYVSREGKFSEANKAFCALLGYSESELCTLRFQEVTDPRDVKADEEMARRVAEDPHSTYAMAKRYITKHGESVWINLFVQAVTNPTEQHQFLHYVVHVVPLPSGDKFQVKQVGNEVRVTAAVSWLDLVKENPKSTFGLAVFVILAIATNPKLGELVVKLVNPLK